MRPMSVLLWLSVLLAEPQALRRLELSDFDPKTRQALAQEPGLAEAMAGERAAERFARFIAELASRNAARAGGGLDYDLPALVAFTCADPREPEMGPVHRRYT